MNRAKPPDARHHIMKYELQHLSTQSGTGCFAPLPVEDLDFEDGLDYIREHPNDEFLHKYLLHLAGTLGPNLTRQLIERGKNDDPHLMALMYEACILNDRLRALRNEFRKTDIKSLAKYTPLIYVNWSLRKDLDKKAHWLKLLSENIHGLQPPPPPTDLQHPIPFDRETMDAWPKRVVPITDVLRQGAPAISRGDATPGCNPAETSRTAGAALKAVDLRIGH